MAGLTETAIAQRPDLTTAIAELYAGWKLNCRGWTRWPGQRTGARFGPHMALDGRRRAIEPDACSTPGPLDDATNAPLPDPEPPIPTVMIKPLYTGETSQPRCDVLRP